MDQGNPNQESRVNYANRNILWHFLTAVIWPNNNSLTDAKICVTVQFLLCYFEFEGSFQVQAPRGLYLEGWFNVGFFALRVWGAYTWEGFYFQNFTVSVVIGQEPVAGNQRNLVISYL